MREPPAVALARVAPRLATWLLAALALPAGGCRVDRAPYEQKVYACDLRASDYAAECGAGWTCHSGTQLGTYDFCAPACAPDGGVDYCASDGALLQPCDPAAGATACGKGLQCLRTSVTASEGLCLPVEVCSKDDDCVDPVRAECLSKTLASFYGDAVAPASASNLWCLQGGCNELSSCAPGFSCLGGLPVAQKLPDVCVPNCGRDALCPKSFVCASQALASLSYRFCLPGLFGFPCTGDDQCLVGACHAVGSHTSACTPTCTSNAQCEAYFHRPDSGVAAAACVGGSCVTPFSTTLSLLCSPKDSRCPAGAECVKLQDLADGGVPGDLVIGDTVCYKRCTSPGDCRDMGSARACAVALGVVGACVPGFAYDRGTFWIECDPADPDSCVKGLECKTRGLKSVCTIGCASDADCRNNPWIPAEWTCTGLAGNKLCER